MSYNDLSDIPVGKRVKLCVSSNYICLGSKEMIKRGSYIIATVLGHEPDYKTIIGCDAENVAKLFNDGPFQDSSYSHLKQKTITNVHYELCDEVDFPKSLPLFLGASLLSTVVFASSKSPINKIKTLIS
jgi:hypothetical protein